MLIAATSDFHGLTTMSKIDIKRKLQIRKEVDLVVVAGDISPSYEQGPYQQMDDLLHGFLPWCKSLGVPVVFTLGNHDYLEPAVIRHAIASEGLSDRVFLLMNENIEIDGVSFYGNPWTPPFCGWNYNTPEKRISAHLDNMWGALDVFITHGPPAGWCDRVTNEYSVSEPLGSTAIRDAIIDFNPTWTVCGHIHTGDHNVQTMDTGQQIVNVSLRNEQYKPVFDPFYFEIT